MMSSPSKARSSSTCKPSICSQQFLLQRIAITPPSPQRSAIVPGGWRKGGPYSFFRLVGGKGGEEDKPSAWFPRVWFCVSLLVVVLYDRVGYSPGSGHPKQHKLLLKPSIKVWWLWSFHQWL